MDHHAKTTINCSLKYISHFMKKLTTLALKMFILRAERTYKAMRSSRYQLSYENKTVLKSIDHTVSLLLCFYV